MTKEKIKRTKSFKDLSNLINGELPFHSKGKTKPRNAERGIKKALPSIQDNGIKKKKDENNTSIPQAHVKKSPERRDKSGNPPGGRGGSGAERPPDKRFPLPFEVTQGIRWRECENFSLLFHRFLPSLSIEKGPDKLDVWNKIARIGNQLAQRDDPILFGIRQIHMVGTLKALYGRENITIIKGKTVWRLSIGLGNRGPLETGITLHPLYGIPYLPGTALKGICRAWKINEIADELGIPALSHDSIKALHNNKGKKTPRELLEQFIFADQSKREARWNAIKAGLKDESELPDVENHPVITGEKGFEDIDEDATAFCAIFGDQDQKGCVVFYDAYPVIDPKNKGFKMFELDIINVHYPEYYETEGAKPPADYLSPRPIYFLTVPEGVEFLIFMAGKENNYVKTASKWLKNALGDLGIGAKTSVGYGELDGVCLKFERSNK